MNRLLGEKQLSLAFSYRRGSEPKIKNFGNFCLEAPSLLLMLVVSNEGGVEVGRGEIIGCDSTVNGPYRRWG
jgi:hypothetical protein